MSFFWLIFVVLTLVYAAPVSSVDNRVVVEKLVDLGIAQNMNLEKDHINPRYSKSGLIQTNATTNSNIFYWLAEAQRYSNYNRDG